MSERPRILIKRNNLDIFLDILSYLIVVAIWTYLLCQYSHLPETVPTHYNAQGVVDGMGNKSSLFLSPIIVTILVIVMTIVNRFPHIFNYPISITEANAERQYTNATRLIRCLKVIIALVLGQIEFVTIQNALGKTNGLGSWMLPTILVLIFVPIIIYMIVVLRKK